MKKKIIAGLIGVVGVVGLMASSFFLGFDAGKKFPETIVVQGVEGGESSKPGGVNFDVFWQAWQKINQVNSHNAIPSWLYQIAKNNVIDYYRMKKTTVAIDDVANVLEDAATPIDEMSLGFDQRRILKTLEQLPVEQQQIIQYKFFEDLTNQEIALIMNKTEGAIRVLQHRAVTRLRELLKRP